MISRLENNPGRPQLTHRRERSGITGLRLLTTGGAISLLLYVGYYVLMLSRSLWESPTLMPDKWKTVFRPIRDLFPREWVMARKGTEIALLNNLLYVLLIAALFAVYLFVILRLWKGGILSAQDGGGALRRIVFFTVLAMMVLFVVHGALSSDLYSYVWYGRIFAIYGDNPLVNVPADYAWSDRARWIQWVFWKETPSVYGPVWLWLAAGIAKTAQLLGQTNDIVTHLLGHKLLASLAHLCNVLLVWRVVGLTLRKYGIPFGSALQSATPSASQIVSMQVAATATYAWNPLAVLEFAANGHNDVLMLAFILCAVWLYLKGWWRLAMVALAGAVLIKLIAIVLVPGYLWLLLWQGKTERPYWDRETWRAAGLRVAQAVVIFAAVVVLTYVPFWQGPEVLQSMTGVPPATRTVHSLADFFKFKGAEWLSALAHSQQWYSYMFWEPAAIAGRLDWPLRWGPIMITATWAVMRTWGARTFPEMVRAWGWVLFLYLTIGAVWYWPWYASWLLVPVALLGIGRLMRASLILAGSSMLVYAMHPKVAPPLSELPRWTGLVVMAPPLVYLFGAWIRDRVAQRRSTPTPEETPLPAHGHGLVPVAVPVPLRPHPAMAAFNDDVPADGSDYPHEAPRPLHELF